MQTVKENNVYKAVPIVTRHYWKREIIEYPEPVTKFESGTPGTYEVAIEENARIHIDICGGGGNSYKATTKTCAGGSGAYIYGDTDIEKGNYNIVVGGKSQSSSFNGNIAGGGNNASSDSYNITCNIGAGGTATVISSGLTGSNGVNGSSTSRIANYGGSNQTGYAKIIALSHEVITPATADDYDFYTDETVYKGVNI